MMTDQLTRSFGRREMSEIEETGWGSLNPIARQLSNRQVGCSKTDRSPWRAEYRAFCHVKCVRGRGVPIRISVHQESMGSRIQTDVPARLNKREEK